MEWLKFTQQLPPYGTTIIIAMRNKNMGEAGIWLYDVCEYYGGDIEDNDNWEGKINWERPVYWSYINEPK
jgi:hypothetical protein